MRLFQHRKATTPGVVVFVLCSTAFSSPTTEAAF